MLSCSSCHSGPVAVALIAKAHMTRIGDEGGSSNGVLRWRYVAGALSSGRITQGLAHLGSAELCKESAPGTPSLRSGGERTGEGKAASSRASAEPWPFLALAGNML